MNIYLLRHAIAEDKSRWSGPDSERPLAKEGVREMKKVAKGMRKLGLEFDRILTSPYRRAYDTAMITARAFKMKNKVTVSQPLAVEGSYSRLIHQLKLNQKHWESVLLVGHEPYLSRLIGILVAGTDQASIDFKKSGLAKLTMDVPTYGRCATLDWILTPKILRKLK